MGLGRRTFAPGEVLTASNVMNYLMDQSVMNFAGTAARGSAIGTAVAEGMVSYINDTDSLEVYRAIGTAAPGWQPVTFPGDSGIPFRQAAGVTAGNTTNGSNSSGWFWNAPTTVTFPVGRFTQAPVVTVLGDATNIIMLTQMAAVPTTSGFSFVNIRLLTYPTNQNGYWTAIQMTPTSGAG